MSSVLLSYLFFIFPAGARLGWGFPPILILTSRAREQKALKRERKGNGNGTAITSLFYYSSQLESSAYDMRENPPKSGQNGNGNMGERQRFAWRGASTSPSSSSSYYLLYYHFITCFFI
jgi:hypothetical protein